MDGRSAQKTLGVPVDAKLTTNQQRALGAKEANGVLGWGRRSVASGARETILPFCSALGRPLLERWVPQYVRDVDVLERVQ